MTAFQHPPLASAAGATPSVAPTALCTAAWITRWFRMPITGYLVTDGARVRFLTTDGVRWDLPLATACAGRAPWYTAGTTVALRVDGRTEYVSFAPPNNADAHDPAVLTEFAGPDGARLALEALGAPPATITNGRHAARRWQAILDRGAVVGSDTAAVQALVGQEAARQHAELVRPAWRDWGRALLRIALTVFFGFALCVQGIAQQQDASGFMSALGWVFIIGGPLMAFLGTAQIVQSTRARRRLVRANAMPTVAAAAGALIVGAVLAPSETSGAQAASRAAASAATVACTPGQRLEVVDFGKWHAAVVIGVRNDAYAPCRVHWIGYATTMDGWVPLSYLRATGAGPVEPIPGGPNASDPTLDSIRRGGAPAARTATSVALGHYQCVAFVVNHLASSGEFTITGATTYRAGATAGTYAYDARTGLVRFQGGTWDGQSGEYAAAPRPTVQIRGPSGRQVMGCEAAGR